MNELVKSKAACKGQDTSLFFIDNGPLTSKRVRIGISKAKSICKSCDIQVECLMNAVNNEENHGIWGGFTQKERAKFFPEARSISYDEAFEAIKWTRNT